MSNVDTNETGYEDIYSAVPYLDHEHEEERCLIHMLYVPPAQRHQGVGKSLFKDFLKNLPPHIKYLRLKSANLGSGDTLPFWQSLGFTAAYSGNSDASQILHLAVNGHVLPIVEVVSQTEERHYIFD